MNLIVSLPFWKCLPLLAISKNKNKSKITKASLAPQNATLPAPNVSPIKIFLSLIKIRKFPYHLWTMVFAVSSAWNALHQLFPLFPPSIVQGSNPHLLCFLHWQADSLLLLHLGSRSTDVRFEFNSELTYLEQKVRHPFSGVDYSKCNIS